jgi:hypothetical protein
MASVAGWYADPTGKSELRYWDGSAWTERTKNRAKGDGKPMEATGPAKKKAARPRSEICIVSWAWTHQRAQDRRTRKDYPYEIWFVANAIGPDGLYEAAASDVTFYAGMNSYYQSGDYRPRFDHQIPKTEFSVASFNDLVQKLWADGWEPSSGGGKNSLWYEYRFRRTAAE